jgi:hypothetical protein
MAGSLRSCRHHGVIYIAKRSRRGSRKLLWSFEGDRNRNRRTSSGPTNLENQRVNDVTG